MQKEFDEVIEFLGSPTEQEMIINGPAGSGKTYLINQLIQNNILPQDTRFTATTNKAANVVAEAIGEDVGTIFSTLCLVPRDNYKTGKTELKQTATPELLCSVLIIDESYMLTHDVLHYLDIALGTTTKVIYVGDSYQLPPVFYDESPLVHKNVRTITLSKIWRTSHPEIQEMSDRFRQAVDTFKFGKLQNIGSQVIVVDVMNFMNNIVNDFKADTNNTKILGWTNSKTISYNNFVNKLLNHKDGFNVGDHVIINKPIEYNNKIVFSVDSEAVITLMEENNSSFHGLRYINLNLSNTATGHLATNPEELAKILDKYAKNKDWKNFFEVKNFFSDIRHTYACTVHKSQGSTYKNVYIDVSDIVKNKNIKEVARLMYVAVSRASEKITLCTDTSGIDLEVQMLSLLKIH